MQKCIQINVINFEELHLISGNLGKGFKYTKFLAETVKLIEVKVNEAGRCHVAVALDPTFMRRLLEIMKGGLKNELSKQSDSIVKKTLNTLCFCFFFFIFFLNHYRTC